MSKITNSSPTPVLQVQPPPRGGDLSVPAYLFTPFINSIITAVRIYIPI